MMGVASKSHPIGRSRHEHALISGCGRRPPSSITGSSSPAAERDRRVRRHFAVSIATATTITLDSTLDWRDRFARLCASHSTLHDIRPGKTDDEQANWSAGVTGVAVARYLGANVGFASSADKDRGYALVLIAERARRARTTGSPSRRSDERRAQDPERVGATRCT